MVIDRSVDGFRLGGIFEIFVPLITTLISVVLTFLPFGVAPGWSFTPALGLIALFFWAMYRPALLPPLVVFLIGLYHDLLNAGPLGLWTLTYLVFYGFFVERRAYYVGRTFKSLWPTFFIGIVIASFVLWSVSCLFHFRLLSPLPVLVQGAITVLFYPVWSRVMVKFNRLISAH